jgi:hypothetical protein
VRQSWCVEQTENRKPFSFNTFTVPNLLNNLASGVHPLLRDVVSSLELLVWTFHRGSLRDGHTSTNGVKTISDATVIESVESCAAQLSQFFRMVQPVTIPADVIADRSGNAQLRETVVVEFCGREHAIFRSALPLEYNDDVRLKTHEGTDQMQARVVAVQYHEGVKAVAVRFQSGPCHWVTTT